MKTKSPPTDFQQTRNKIAFVLASLMMFTLPMLVFKMARKWWTNENVPVVAAVVGSVITVKMCFLVYVFRFDSLNFPRKKNATSKSQQKLKQK